MGNVITACKSTIKNENGNPLLSFKQLYDEKLSGDIKNTEAFIVLRNYLVRYGVYSLKDSLTKLQIVKHGHLTLTSNDEYMNTALSDTSPVFQTCLEHFIAEFCLCYPTPNDLLTHSMEHHVVIVHKDTKWTRFNIAGLGLENMTKDKALLSRIHQVAMIYSRYREWWRVEIFFEPFPHINQLGLYAHVVNVDYVSHELLVHRRGLLSFHQIICAI